MMPPNTAFLIWITVKNYTHCKIAIKKKKKAIAKKKKPICTKEKKLRFKNKKSEEIECLKLEKRARFKKNIYEKNSSL